jgi:hypothetical protein
MTHKVIRLEGIHAGGSSKKTKKGIVMAAKKRKKSMYHPKKRKYTKHRRSGIRGVGSIFDNILGKLGKSAFMLLGIIGINKVDQWLFNPKTGMMKDLISGIGEDDTIILSPSSVTPKTDPYIKNAWWRQGLLSVGIEYLGDSLGVGKTGYFESIMEGAYLSSMGHLAGKFFDKPIISTPSIDGIGQLQPNQRLVQGNDGQYYIEETVMEPQYGASYPNYQPGMSGIGQNGLDPETQRLIDKYADISEGGEEEPFTKIEGEEETFNAIGEDPFSVIQGEEDTFNAVQGVSEMWNAVA